MALNVYNGGASSHGQNTVVHHYDRAGVKAANAVNVYQQFADRKSMPLKKGKTYKISKFLHIYDRNQNTDPDFAAKGFLSKRTLDELNAGLSAAALGEGAGAQNQVGIEKITMEASFARYGHMIEYTDEVEMFSEDAIQVRYREELGALINVRNEDLIQKGLLSQGNLLCANDEATKATLGTGVGADDTNAEKYKISFDLMRKAVKKLVRNRAKKKTSIVTGSTKVDTRTINSAYYGIIGAEVKYDLESLTRGSGNAEEFAYIPRYKYASSTNLAEGECGAMHDVRFIESESAVHYGNAGAHIPKDYAGELSYTPGTDDSSDTETDRGRFDVFPVLFPTEGCYATIGLKGHGKVKFKSMSPEALDRTNPYGTKGFFSANFWFAGIVLDETKLLEVQVLATA